MKTAHRISALANQLNELQACLGRASGQSSKPVVEAQRIAAELASSLEEWHLETLHIPDTERSLYRAQNPYYAAQLTPCTNLSKAHFGGLFFVRKKHQTGQLSILLHERKTLDKSDGRHHCKG